MWIDEICKSVLDVEFNKIPYLDIHFQLAHEVPGHELSFKTTIRRISVAHLRQGHPVHHPRSDSRTWNGGLDDGANSE